jgi:hypothetical protein
MSTNPTYPVDPREMLKNSTLDVKVCASLMNICGVSFPFSNPSHIN